MAISSKQNSFKRMTYADEYFDVGEPFMFKPMGSIEPFVVIVPVISEDIGDCERCVINKYCCNPENRMNGLDFVPQCRPKAREDGNDVIFAYYGGVK